MDDADFQADCTKCVGLCCVSLAFDQSDMFAIDKSAGIPCPNLASDDRCSIHANLQERGFPGCIRFDCLGAGQRVSQEVYPGQSWRDGPAVAKDMFDAFWTMRKIQEQRQLLHLAEKLPLDEVQSAKHAELVNDLSPKEGWSPAALKNFQSHVTATVVQSFLSGLRNLVG